MADGTDTNLVIEFDFTPSLNSITNFGFTTGDAMVLSMMLSNNPWDTLLSCSVLGGIVSTSINQPASCSFTGGVLYIVNIGGFVADPLLAPTTANRVKLKFTTTGLSNSKYCDFFNFLVKLYANLDAYQNQYQPILYTYTTITSCSALCYYYDPT